MKSEKYREGSINLLTNCVAGYNVILLKLKTMSARNYLVVFICMTPAAWRHPTRHPTWSVFLVPHFSAQLDRAGLSSRHKHY